MKKWIAFTLALLMALSQMPVQAAQITPDGYNHLVVGSTTAFNGNFSTHMWGNNTADLDVEQLLFGYNLINWQYQVGAFDVDTSVVQGISVYDDQQGNRTYELFLADDLYYNDGTRITARDYAFTILFSVAEEVKALGGNTENYGAVYGMPAYKQGQADVLTGVRVLADDRLSITISGEYLPFFYELGLIMCLPLPIHVIAPGCQVRDDGQGVYLDKSAGSFTVEALRKTMLDPATGYLSHPMVTCGPYQLVSFDGNKVEMEINERYKGNADGIFPTIPYITFQTVENETMMDALWSEELGLINKVVDADSIAAGLQLVGDDDARMASYARVGLSLISFNCEQPTVSSAAVRQAIALCLDKDALVSGYVGNYGLRVDGYYGIGQWMYQVLTGALVPELPEPENATEEEKKAHEETLKALEEMTMDQLPMYNLDVEQANQLLDDAGWNLNRNGNAYKAGQDDVRCAMVDGKLVALEISMLYPEGNRMADFMQAAFIDHLKEAGILLTLQPLPMAELLRQYYRQETRDADMIYLATNFSEVFDPTLNYAPVDGINSNYSHLDDAELYRLAQDMARTEPGDIAGYLEKWLAFQDRWLQVLPAIPVYSNAYFDFHTPMLQDYNINAHTTWGDAILEAYLGDRSETDLAGLESEYVEGGIIIID